MTFSPNSPVGFTIRITIRRANVNASEKVVKPRPLMMFSQIPMINAPTTAPGIEPIPPNKRLKTRHRTRSRRNAGVVGEEQQASDCGKKRADNKGCADNAVNANTHQLTGFKILGGGTHGHADFGIADKADQLNNLYKRQ